MLHVRVYTVKGGKLIEKSPKVRTFKELRPFLDKHYPQNYVEVHGKRAIGAKPRAKAKVK